jgi:hypothetical protein
VTRLIHLNGPPGVGKSTLARRYAAEHPGTLLCDLDLLRTWISGWQDDREAADRTRTAGLAMMSAYLATGRDVVLPLWWLTNGMTDVMVRGDAWTAALVPMLVLAGFAVVVSGLAARLFRWETI